MKHEVCTVMQPTYIPWLGYFDLIEQADKFVFLDDVQVEKNSWQLRNRIKTAQGELYLSISRRNNRGEKLYLINKTEMNDVTRWREKHLRSIETAYAKAEYFVDVFPFVESLIHLKTTNLCDFNMNIIRSIAESIGIETSFFVSSELDGIEGVKDHRVACICNAVGCDVYLSPPGAAGYINREKPGGVFMENNVSLFYHMYQHPVYQQLYGDFLPYMSIVDLLFNEGFKKSLDIIKKGERQPIGYMDF